MKKLRGMFICLSVPHSYETFKSIFLAGSTALTLFVSMLTSQLIFLAMSEDPQLAQGNSLIWLLD